VHLKLILGTCHSGLAVVFAEDTGTVAKQNPPGKKIVIRDEWRSS
jgi:hypothetical protein